MKKITSKRYIAIFLSILVIAELLFTAGFGTLADSSDTEFNPLVTDFEEGNTLDEFVANTEYEFSATANSGIIEGEGVTGNAFNFKKALNTTGIDYDSKFTLKLVKNVEKSRGISFMLKNPTGRKLSLRIWIGVGTDTSSTASVGKYQMVYTIPADQVDYKKHTILWDNVGSISFMSDGQWWAGSSSGSTMTPEEIASGITLRFINGSGSIRYNDAGLLFDDFRYVTDEDFAKRDATLLDFSNCEAGGKLPSNITVGDYKGSNEIVEKADGSKALQINFDKVVRVEGNEIHQTSHRTNAEIFIKVPKGSLNKLEKVNFSLTYNGYPLAQQTGDPMLVVYTAAVVGEGIFVKQGESAGYFSEERGTTREITLQVKNGHAGNDFYYLTNWLSKGLVVPVTDEHYETFDEIRLYLAIPEIDAETAEKKGYNVQLNYVDLVFEEAPLYNEEDTRLVFNGEEWSIDSTNEKTITSTYNKITSNDINYRTFKQSFTVKAKAGNTAPVITKNSLIKFLRNADPYLDDATFRIYTRSKVETKAQVAFITADGKKLPFEIDVKKSKTDRFDETNVSLKEIYDNYINNGGKKISLKDIVALEILPLSSKAVEFEVSSPTLWTENAGNSASSGNYYRSTEDDGIRIEAYNDNIPEDFDAILEDLDVDATLEMNSTKIPSGAEVVGIFKITLRNASGEIAEPPGRFWVSYKVPNEVEFSTASAYELFFDGSLVPVKLTSVERGGYISFEEYFTSKTFAILSFPQDGIIGENENSEDEPAEQQYKEVYTTITTWEEKEEIVETQQPTTEEIIIKHKIKKKKPKVEESGMPYWIWYAVAGAGVLIVVAAVVIILIIVRKKNKTKGEKLVI